MLILSHFCHPVLFSNVAGLFRGVRFAECILCQIVTSSTVPLILFSVVQARSVKRPQY